MIALKSVPLFGTNVWFCDDQDHAREFLKDFDEDPASIEELVSHRGFFSRLTANDGRQASLMCVFDRDDALAIAAHEAVHAAWWTLRHVSVRVKADTDEEPLAYLVSWFTAEMVRFLERAKSS